MTLLFKEVSIKGAPSLFKNIFHLAFEHGKNLGLFVFSYKAGYKILDKIIGKTSGNHFISGLIFGSLIFGKKTGVNHQIVLYLLSRVLVGLASLLYKKICVLMAGKWNFI
jgi:peroxisomal membrane protein 4